MANRFLACVWNDDWPLKAAVQSHPNELTGPEIARYVLKDSDS
jgi:hypothetical protein